MVENHKPKAAETGRINREDVHILGKDRYCDSEMRAIMANGVDWLWETNSEHKFTWLSDSVEDVTGVSNSKIVGNSRYELFANIAKDNPTIAEHLDDLDARRPFKDLVYKLAYGTGKCRWISVSGVPVFDENGEFRGYRGTGRNITKSFAIRDELDETRKELEYHRELTVEVIESLRAGLIVFGADERIILCNSKMREIYPGLGHVLRPGTSMTDLFETAYDTGQFDVISGVETEPPADDRECWIRTRLAECNDWVAERVCQLDDGNWIQVRNLRLDNGVLIGLRVDVTEIKQREAEAVNAQADAEAANERLQQAIEALKDGFVIWDSEDRLVAFNEAFRNQFSNGQSMQKGRTFSEMLREFAATGDVPDAVGREDKWVQELAGKRMEELDQEIVFKTHDGRWIMRRDQLTPNGDRVGIRTNVTEIKKRESEAEEARKQLATVLESLPAGVMIFDSDDCFVLANKRMRESYPEFMEIAPGFELRRLVEMAYDSGRFAETGDPDLDSLYNVDAEKWAEAFFTKEYTSRYYEHDRKETGGRWVKAINLRTEDGLFVGVRIDITEQKRREEALACAEQKAILADRAKSEFLANMSHEIRTPMNGVLGMAELLAKTELDSKQKTFTEIIVKSGNALLTIINDILDFSKIDAGHLTLDPQPFSLSDAINDVATLVSTRAKEKDLELIVRVQPGLPENVVGDVGRIRQIVINLLGNAVKFTDVGHVLVNLSGAVDGDNAKLRFEVRDTGIGIAPDKLDNVFDKFSQADSSSTRRHEGTGLGLAISSRLIDLMGGRMGVESTEGTGSTFWFEITLPVAGEVTNRNLTPVDVTGARILIIDDNDINRSILIEQTRSWAFDSCAAASGREGLLVLEKATEMGINVDCLVLDYQMPGMTGEDVARVIRSGGAHRDVPIIMLTSVDQTLSSPAIKKLRISAHLLKPARSSQLLEAIVETIRAHRHFNGGAEGTGLPLVGATSPESITPDVSDGLGVNDPALREETYAASKTGAGGKVETARKEGACAPDDLDILVAEDNEVNQIVFSQILGDTGCKFEIVADGKRAIEAWRERRPRMIFMDISMPEMNGFEATRAIRAAEGEAGLDRTPIVGVTAYALKGDRDRCFEAGMDGYLSKPVSPGALLQKIAEYLEEASGAVGGTG